MGHIRSFGYRSNRDRWHAIVSFIEVARVVLASFLWGMTKIAFWAFLIFFVSEVAQSGKSAQFWMSILYPIMTATSFMVTVAILLYYIRVHSERIVIALFLFMASETAALALLTLATGTNPVLSIEQYRPLIVCVRFVELISMLWIIYVSAVVVLHVEKRHDLFDRFSSKGDNDEN